MECSPWLDFWCLWRHKNTKWTSPSVQLPKTPLPKRTINAWKKPEKWLSLWPFQGLSFSWHTHYLQNQMCLSKHYSDVCFGPQRSDSWPLTRWQWSIPAEILSLGLFIPRSISALPASPATFCCWGAFKANNNPIWDWSMAACGQQAKWQSLRAAADHRLGVFSVGLIENWMFAKGSQSTFAAGGSQDLCAQHWYFCRAPNLALLCLAWGKNFAQSFAGVIFFQVNSAGDSALLLGKVCGKYWEYLRSKNTTELWAWSNKGREGKFLILGVCKGFI